jgi:hypothetical protein
MNRCLRRAVLALGLVLLGAFAHAQGVGITRTVPADVKPGMLAVQDINGSITLDGKSDRFAPGIRVHDLNNMLVLSGSLVGRSVPTLYRREATTGQVHEVWLLTQDEYRQLGGGARDGDPEGHRRFAELLNMIFAARMGLRK